MDPAATPLLSDFHIITVHMYHIAALLILSRVLSPELAIHIQFIDEKVKGCSATTGGVVMDY